MEDQEQSTLEPTWWFMDTEPGMDDLAGDGTVDVLAVMKDKLKIFPFQDLHGKDRLFLARFEIPKYGEDFQFTEAVFAPGAVAFIDFLAGFPVECVEMLVAIGEYSSQAKDVAVKDGTGKPVAPMPDKLFEWPEKDKILLNLTGIATAGVAKILAKNLEGEPEPKKVHWWLRTNLVNMDEKKWPIPGEFFGLGVRMFPDKPWGKQKSSPFIYSGNWLDTVYLTGGVVKEVIDPTDIAPYSTYTVAWHGKEIKNVRPSDFCEYKVGDRATVLKDVSTDKKTSLWKDKEQTEFGNNWVLEPITYYGGL